MKKILHVSDGPLLLFVQGLKWVEKSDRYDYQRREIIYSLRYAYEGAPQSYEYGEGPDALVARDDMFSAVKSALIT